jgi:hypothetical protein
MVPTWMRGTSVESAVSVLQPSSIAPSRSFVLGMKWSVTHATSHRVASACFHISRTAGHVWLPMLVNMPKRIVLSFALGDQCSVWDSRAGPTRVAPPSTTSTWPVM